MTKTTSNMLTLETYAPLFTLIDTISGNKFVLKTQHDIKATIIMFICNHCPYVKHIIYEVINMANDYKNKHVQFIAINSNDIINYPDDSPENMKNIAKLNNYPFPYLYDETQEVAIAYKAACTPDFYLFDKNLILKYRGQFDNSRPGNAIEITGLHLRTALDSILLEQPVIIEQLPSLGCNIKWLSSVC